jgi:Tfp pilus assembly protein PilF
VSFGGNAWKKNGSTIGSSTKPCGCCSGRTSGSGPARSMYPTAEAHTYLGWTYSFKGRYSDAIEQCKLAIRIDPEFGNPYNDIGSYLIHLGRVDQAIPWLEQAKKASRYEPRHFPYLNLYRVYTKLGRLDAAQRELQQALFIQQSLEMQAGASPDDDLSATVN